MRSVIYTRVSQDRTNGGRSVGEQEDECRALCAREGWEVVEVFTDNDRSASRYAHKARPAFDALRDYIEHHDCDVLVTWEASRSTRDLATYVQLRDLCRVRGVRWSYSGRTYDLNDDVDQFGTGLDALLAEQESARSRKRVMRSMRANAVAGRPHGRNNYGYRRVYDSNNRQLLAVEFHPDEAAVLREAAERLLSGESLKQLVDDFNARGLVSQSGGRWYPVTIKRCLTSPTYAGKRVHQGEIVADAMWPPMFDDSTWWRLQAVLTDPARDTARGHHNVKYLLSGVAMCGKPGCGASTYLANNRGTPAYVCNAGAHVTRNQAPLDEYVQDILLTGLAQPSRRVVFDGDEPPATAALWAAIEAKRARLDGFYDAAASGEISAGALARIEQQLLGEIAREEATVRRASLPPKLRALGHLDLVAEWDSLPVMTKRAVIRHYLDITILPCGSGRRRGFDPTKVAVTWK